MIYESALGLILAGILAGWMLILRASIKSTDRMVRMFNSDLCKRVANLEKSIVELEKYFRIKYCERRESGYELVKTCVEVENDI